VILDQGESLEALLEQGN